jgi:glycosyltransferase involved in cell wall biosynthesis
VRPHCRSGVPTFSVVIPSFNTAATIELTLRSVLAQTDPDLEVIVGDDGSTDQTLAIVERVGDGRASALRLDHRGAAAARNAGIAASRGRFIAFLDSDDLWLPEYLAEMRRALDDAPDAGFAFTDAWVIDAAGRRVRKVSVVLSPVAEAPPVDPGDFLRSLLEENFVYTSVCVRREVLERVGGFDETLPAAIDYELWLRVAANGYRGVRAPGRLAVYRAGRPGSISSSRRRVAVGLVAAYQRVVDSHPVGEPERERARALLAEMQRDLAALDGERSVDAAWRRLKPRLARLKHDILRDNAWRAHPPDELTAAFPTLFRTET